MKGCHIKKVYFFTASKRISLSLDTWHSRKSLERFITKCILEVRTIRSVILDFGFIIPKSDFSFLVTLGHSV